jgi:hypothetical protein
MSSTLFRATVEVTRRLIFPWGHDPFPNTLVYAAEYISQEQPGRVECKGNEIVIYATD